MPQISLPLQMLSRDFRFKVKAVLFDRCEHDLLTHAQRNLLKSHKTIFLMWLAIKL